MAKNTDKIKIFIGMGTCGIAAGANSVLAAIHTEIHERKIKADIIKTGCIGMCFSEVLVDIVMPGKTRVTYGNVKAEDIPLIFDSHIKIEDIYKIKAIAQIKLDETHEPYQGLPFYEDLPYFSKQKRIVLRRCGFIDPTNIVEYIDADGYKAALKALKEMTPQEIIESVKHSGLRGRGGGGFPTGIKWQLCRQSDGEQKYIICNADEGDPGAFMDRSVLEGDPHAVIEGMIIAGYAIGATKGYIYCRAEYPQALTRLNEAIPEARKKGFLGTNIFGTTFSFDIAIKMGAGSFVCGEETALMASIEGNRGMPRPRPPFPVVSGLWKSPTSINNVETFACVPAIILHGSDFFSSIGTLKSKGTKVFSLTGKIKRTGLIEVPMGISLREIIFDIGGGIVNDKEFKAVQMGGPSGGCLPKDLLDTPIDYDSLIQAGAIMGSGGIVVMDEDNCMVEMAKYFLDFTQNESCGKCVPCRIGIKRMLEILERISEGKAHFEDIKLLEDLGHDIKEASLCGLGQTAPNPALSTIRYFLDEYKGHIENKKCNSNTCKELINLKVMKELCKKCNLCTKLCPAGAIEGGKEVPAFIYNTKCTKCRVCIEKCPTKAIVYV
ncbi:MAG: SLBB domain-containing protein [Candidatus Firestonebacteria bacterium]|nr:SLBB domain-containing protein [Candidatus Firestonebacteria bacterium]